VSLYSCLVVLLMYVRPHALPLNLPPGSEVYTDSAYTDYTTEDDLQQTSQIALKVMRKKNSKRKDEAWNQYIKQCTRQNKRNCV